MKHLESVLRHSPRGGSRIGWSALSQFQECEWSYFLSNILPHPKGGFGISQGDARALWIGAMFHSAMQAWFLSAPETGQYSMDAALAGLEAAVREDGLRERDSDKAAEWESDVSQLFRRYALECGPAGPDPDRDRFRVAFDADGPLVEREFEVDLGYNGYYYTTRIDLVAWDAITPNQLLVVEHKTCDVSRAGSALRGYALDPQLSGETLAVSAAWERGVVPVVNMVKKRAAAKATCRAWEPMPRSPVDLEKFRIDVVRRLKRMDERVEEYKSLVESGVPALEAGSMVFDGSPKGKVCADQGRQCAFYDMCYRKSIRSSLLAATEPHFQIEEGK